MPRRNLLLIFAALGVTLALASRAEQNPQTRHVSRGFRLIDELALDEPPDEELVDGAMRGMISVLRRRGDTHSAYFPPRVAEPLRDEMRQEFGGVGVMIRVAAEPPGGLVVVEPPDPSGPAFDAGVKNGDRIVAIDGHPTEGITLPEALEQLRGPIGAPVDLRLARPQSPPSEENDYLNVTITRRAIKLAALKGDRRLKSGDWRYDLTGAEGVGHVRIAIFGNRTAEELAEVLDDLVSRGVSSVALDLRDNAGGAVDASIAVADLFLDAGAPIMSTRGRGGRVIDEYDAESPSRFDALQMAVLIDRDTASAAEIVAAALADNDRARLFGERSFGKGTVQQLLTVGASRSLLKLTTASYWRPSGVNIHRLESAGDDEPWGVTPDPEDTVPLADEQLETFRLWRRERDLLPSDEAPDALPPGPLQEDAVLAAAVEWLAAEPE
ncbi:MAG: S41 family peptidase [Planctomycetota bacterium]